MTTTKHLTLCALFALGALSARAYDFKTDGIFYNILSEEEQTCEVTGRYSNSSNKDSYEGEVVIPEITTYLGKTYSVAAIGKSAFYNCSGLTGVIIPESVTSVGNYAFYHCSSLTGITLPDVITSIGTSLFLGCTSLTRITIPDAVTSIGDYAFSSCSSLTEINIPDAVTSIGNSAFEYCKNLAELIIPSSVTYIGYYTFQYCSGLTKITSLSTTPPTCISNTFYGAYTSTCVLYVPLGTTAAYSTATGWKDFFNIEEMDMTGVDDISVEAQEKEVAGYYTLDGKALSAPQQGITIVRYADGTTQKVFTTH